MLPPSFSVTTAAAAAVGQMTMTNIPSHTILTSGDVRFTMTRTMTLKIMTMKMTIEVPFARLEVVHVYLAEREIEKHENQYGHQGNQLGAYEVAYWLKECYF